MTRKPRVWWSGPTATSRRRFCPAGLSLLPADFNAQLLDWLMTVANRRKHATTRMIPEQALAADRAAMAALPPVAPATGTTVTTRLGRDYYVSLGGNAYSVHPEVIGRMITVTGRLGPDRRPTAVTAWSLIIKDSGAQLD